ncbi:hypothetical protein ACFLZ9_01405 [Patescibacteria group bacterium]
MLDNFLSLKYWFNSRPGPLDPTMKLVFVSLVVALIIATVILIMVKARNKKSLYYKIFDRIYVFSLSNAVIGIMLLFFTSEEIPILSSRGFFLVWFISMIVWAVFIGKAMMKIPEIKKQKAQAEEFKKYIP